jgi:hypothetical protein
MTITAAHVSRRFLSALPLDALLDTDAESISGRFRSPRSCSPSLMGARHFSGASLSPTHPMSATEWRAPSLDLEVSDWEQREYFSLF